jgi:hypothetical protein
MYDIWTLLAVLIPAGILVIQAARLDARMNADDKNFSFSITFFIVTIFLLGIQGEYMAYIQTINRSDWIKFGVPTFVLVLPLGYPIANFIHHKIIEPFLAKMSQKENKNDN